MWQQVNSSFLGENVSMQHSDRFLPLPSASAVAEGLWGGRRGMGLWSRPTGAVGAEPRTRRRALHAHSIKAVQLYTGGEKKAWRLTPGGSQ